MLTKSSDFIPQSRTTYVAEQSHWEAHAQDLKKNSDVMSTRTLSVDIMERIFMVSILDQVWLLVCGFQIKIVIFL